MRAMTSSSRIKGFCPRISSAIRSSSGSAGMSTIPKWSSTRIITSRSIRARASGGFLRWRRERFTRPILGLALRANLRFVQSGPHGPIVELSVRVGLRPPLTRDFSIPPPRKLKKAPGRCPEAFFKMAERERFELSRDVTPCTLSKGVVSATHPSLRGKNSVGCRLPKLGPPCKTYFQGPRLPETDGCKPSSAPVDLAP